MAKIRTFKTFPGWSLGDVQIPHWPDWVQRRFGYRLPFFEVTVNYHGYIRKEKD